MCQQHAQPAIETYEAPCFTDGTSGAECGRANVSTTTDLTKVNCFECLMMHHGIHNSDVFEEMNAYGSSFVKSLSETWRRADFDNSKKLMAAFSGYFKQYLHIAIHNKQRRESSVTRG